MDFITMTLQNRTIRWMKIIYLHATQGGHGSTNYNFIRHSTFEGGARSLCRLAHSGRRAWNRSTSGSRAWSWNRPGKRARIRTRIHRRTRSAASVTAQGCVRWTAAIAGSALATWSRSFYNIWVLIIHRFIHLLVNNFFRNFSTLFLHNHLPMYSATYRTGTGG